MYLSLLFSRWDEVAVAGCYDWAMASTPAESSEGARPPVPVATGSRVVLCDAGRESEARLAAILEHLHSLVLYEIGGGRMFISSNVAALLGYSPEEITADRAFFRSLIHSGDAPAALAQGRRWRADGSVGTLTLRYRVRRRDGSWVWIEDRMTQVAPPGGRAYLTGALADITAAREAEEQARRGEERSSALIAALPDAVFLLDREGRYLDYHAPADVPLYAPPEEFLGRRMRDVFRDFNGDVHQRHLDRTLATGQLQLYEYEAGTPDNRRFYEVRMVPCGSERVLSIVRNITVRKQAEQAYFRLLDRQRLAVSELDHRLRNNLASLISLIDVTAGEEKHSVESYASVLRSRVQAMAAAHLLLSRAQWSAARLSDLIRAVVPPDLASRVESDGPEVRIDARQVSALAMVLQELLFNSIKYGSLGAADGRVFIEWQLRGVEAPGSDMNLELRWREQGGPHPDRSPRLGAGTSLVTGLVATEFKGRIDLSYPAAGADHRLSLVLSRV